MTKEERTRAEDMGGYFRVAADTRDLKLRQVLRQGQVRTQADEDYTSHNTRRLNVEQTIEKIMTTDYIKEELAKDANEAPACPSHSDHRRRRFCGPQPGGHLACPGLQRPFVV